MVTAISLVLSFAACVAAYVWWAAQMVNAGTNWIWVAIAFPFVFGAFPIACAALWFTVSWIFRAPRPPENQLGISASACLFWREVMAIAGSPPRMIAYRWLMADPPPAPAELPVLLLHGVLCNAGVMHPVKRSLQQRKMKPIYALSYGPPMASIEDF